MLFGIAAAITVPICLSVFILVRRAGRYGFFSETPRSYSWSIFDLMELYENIRSIIANYDMLGFFLWNTANALLLLAIAIPPHKTATRFERQGCIGGGIVAILAFGAWEMYVTGLIVAKTRTSTAARGHIEVEVQGSRPPDIVVTDADAPENLMESHSESNRVASPATTGTTSDQCSSTVINIIHPSDIGSEGSRQLEESTRTTAMRLEQMYRNKRSEQLKFKNLRKPLLSAEALSSGKLLRACLIMGCSSFAFATVSWVLRWNPSWSNHPMTERGGIWLYWVSGVRMHGRSSCILMKPDE
jgi:hypothetical protein